MSVAESLSQTAPIGILGGTFDPVHNAHLRTALELMETLGLAEIRFIPSARPPHRDRPGASPDDRLSMLARAIADQNGFVVDDRELRRAGPSYMVDTLRSLREELGALCPLCLILGWDAFRELESWYRWRELFELAHIVVMSRPDAVPLLPDGLCAQIERCRLTDRRELANRPAGGIWQQTVTALAISATEIRALMAAGRSPRYLLPDAVLQYIETRGLYRPRAKV